VRVGRYGNPYALRPPRAGIDILTAPDRLIGNRVVPVVLHPDGLSWVRRPLRAR
jgi:hypothetical protein